MPIFYDRATTKLLYGLPPDTEYGRWCVTFASTGAGLWRNLVRQRLSPGQLQTSRILVVGCGLGLTVEGFRQEGFQNAWGIGLDDYFASLWSPATCPVMVDGGWYITLDQATKTWTYTPIAAGQQWPCEVDQTTLRPFLGIFDVRTMTATQVQQFTGLTGAQRKFNLIITEDMLTAYGAQADYTAIYNNIDNVLLAPGGSVRHLVSLGSDLTQWGGSGVKTLADWNTTLGTRTTDHTFQDISGVSAQLAAPR